MPTFRTSHPDSVADPSLPHVLLVGLPGSGKSTVGAILGKQLGRTFLDFDHEIVRRQGMSIGEIFGMHGEHRFRELELDGLVPDSIEQVVFSCLEKDPKDRPQSARELMERYETALAIDEMGLPGSSANDPKTPAANTIGCQLLKICF